jgi:hypothetical protein
MIKIAIIIIYAITMVTPALADPLYCSRWLDITTCSSPSALEA